MVHFLFTELANENIRVNWNLFGEKHGKNARDQHFSAISHFIKCESMVKRLRPSKDIVDAIYNRQILANRNRIRLKLDPILFWVGEFHIPIVVRKVYRIIPNIRHYYNFHNDEKNVLKSTILSNKIKLMNVDSDIQAEDNIGGDHEVYQHEKVITDTPINIEKMRKKRFAIEKLLEARTLLPEKSRSQTYQRAIVKPNYCHQGLK